MWFKMFLSNLCLLACFSLLKRKAVMIVDIVHQYVSSRHPPPHAIAKYGNLHGIFLDSFFLVHGGIC